MTRGSAFLIADEYMIESIEFNGDMYRDGLGQDMINMLEKNENVSQFKAGIEGFNKENHGYEEVELDWLRVRSDYIEENTRGEYIITFDDNNYFKLYFSDWTFWKNISSKDVTFRTREYGKIKLEKGQTVAINFGYQAAHYFGHEEFVAEETV